MEIFVAPIIILLIAVSIRAIRIVPEAKIYVIERLGVYHTLQKIAKSPLF